MEFVKKIAGVLNFNCKKEMSRQTKKQSNEERGDCNVLSYMHHNWYH